MKSKLYLAIATTEAYISEEALCIYRSSYDRDDTSYLIKAEYHLLEKMHAKNCYARSVAEVAYHRWLSGNDAAAVAARRELNAAAAARREANAMAWDH